MTRLLLVGCGKMGGALLRGWSKKPDLAISVLEPNDPQADFQDVHDIPATMSFDVIVLAVKPQVMESVCISIKNLPRPSTLVLSIAAGKSITFFENIFSPSQPVIRCMPNTPAAIGKGISVLCGNRHVSDTQKELGLALLSSVGCTEWIEDEILMDAVTAVSGSGPAYVFLLIEALTAAGIEAGLSESLSANLARQTVIGSAYLAESDEKTPASTLRQNVTSPGGTTESALKILMGEHGLADLMTKAIQAARIRGQELGSADKRPK